MENPQPNPRTERALVGLLVTSAVLALAGAVFANTGAGWHFTVGVVVLGGAVLVAVASTAVSYRVDRIHTIAALRSRGDKYDQMRQWTRFKVASILLQALLVLAAIVVLVGLLTRIGVVQPNAGFRTTAFGVTALLAFILVTLQVSHAFSLRLKVTHDNAGLDNALMVILLSGAAVVTLIGILGELGAHSLVGFGRTERIDAPFFILAGLVLTGAALFVGRNLPTLYALFYEERAYYKGKTYFSKSKSVVMPAMIAFSLLFVTVLFMMVFGIGIASEIERTRINALVIGIAAFLAVLLAVSLGASIWLSRVEDKAKMFRVKRSAEDRRRILVLSASLATASILLAIAGLLFSGRTFLGLGEGSWLDFVTFGILAALGPFGFYVATQASRTRHLEERFPDFLRDIASSHKAGLPLPTAVRIAANGEYGALTPEIRKMADQLTWNVGFTDVMQRFATRVDTPLIRRSVNLMIEAAASGGNIVDVLNAAARDAREIKNLESERRQSMSLYTAVIYLTFFVFLAVVVLMYKTFVSELVTAANASVSSGSGGFAGIQFSSLTLDDYRIFYFVAAIMQGLGNGIMAGLMGTGRLLMGLRHSFVMVTITYVVFKMTA